MNKDFENEIIEIAKSHQDQDNYKPETLQHSSEDEEYVEVINIFSQYLKKL